MCWWDTPKAADTSAQSAEAARQQAVNDAAAAADRDARNKQAADQLAATNAQTQQILQQQQADAAALRQQEQDIADRTLSAQQKTDAASQAFRDQQAASAKAETDRATAAAAQRASDVGAYAASRKATIDALTGQINSAYGGFDQSYYDKFAKDFTDNYSPQIDSEYSDAGRKTDLSLGEQGILDSSAAGRQHALLDQTFANQKSKLATDASNAADNLRSSIDQQRSDLLAKVTDGTTIGPMDAPADISSGMAGITNGAATIRSQLGNGPNVPTPSYAPLSDAFASLVPTGGGAAAPIGGGPLSLAALSGTSSSNKGGSARIVQ